MWNVGNDTTACRVGVEEFTEDTLVRYTIAKCGTGTIMLLLDVSQGLDTIYIVV
jgi:hypothetical protein